MRLTLKERLAMVLEHLHEGKSYSYLGKKYQFDIPKLKYMVNFIFSMGKPRFKIGRNKCIEEIQYYSRLVA